MEGRWNRKPGATGRSTVVIFIHGLLSSSETCWLHENGTRWPDLLTAEADFSGLGVYEFTYHTSVFSGSYSLGDVVDAFKESLALDGVTEANRLLIVAHSMGGIVARRYIVQHLSDLARRGTQVGLFLVASPSLGSTYASWLRPLAQLLGHSQARALAFCENNTWLNDLNNDFRNALGKKEVTIVGKELVEDRFVVVKRLGIFPRVVPTISGVAFFGDALRIPLSDHFSIAKPGDAGALQHRLLCKFVADFDEINRIDGRVSESDGSIRAQVGRDDIRIVYGSIEQLPVEDFDVVALPCNEYFDNLCSADTRSALGSFVESRYPGRTEEFSELVMTECKRALGDGTIYQKTATESAQSFGVGSSILLTNPLGSRLRVALVSTTKQRAGQGLSGRVSNLFGGMHSLFALMADARLNTVLMPLMGSGHGGISPPLALVGVLLAIAEASRSGNEHQPAKTITIVIFRGATEIRPSVTRQEIRNALALFANPI